MQILIIQHYFTKYQSGGKSILLNGIFINSTIMQVHSICVAGF